MATKKQASVKAAKKPKSKGKAKGGAKAQSKAKAKGKGKAAKRPAARTTGVPALDKSVEQFRESLEHNVTLSRDRVQEVVDDTVKRGRMTASDAEKMVSTLIRRGRRQTDALLEELEKLVQQARRGVSGRGASQRKKATSQARRARRKLD